ncbi:cytochrome c oxidase assembly protein [Rhizomonospora bruguierae]|uniref:cytochrome c oxidase assembly protein n=1 Tax=Rhizomonospora bruguierae TaxID=1581705 RepID=UPI001BCFA41E|nr:cytochrome c oxidase assembly protein [Micromonospora sp. NBRC 107566]
MTARPDPLGPPLAYPGGGTAAAWTQIAGVLLIAALAAGYGRGVHELWSRRGVGAVVPRWRAASFGAGLFVLALAGQDPVHALAERSFAGHMTQHMLLLVVAGPLLAAGGAGLPLTLAGPRRLRRWAGRGRATPAARWLRAPTNLALLAAGAHTVVLWAWHLPTPYLLAEGDEVVHAVEHATFVGAAWLLWSTVFAPRGAGLSAPVGFLLLFATGMPAAALGAVLTLAPVPLYPDGVLAAAHPLADQQLAGLVMWVPMDVIVLLVAVAVFLRWLVRLDRSAPPERDLKPPDTGSPRQEEVPA